MSSKIKTALLSFSIVAVLVIADAWILRLPCKTEGEFSVKKEGYALENSIIGRHTSTYLIHCIEKCFNENKCKSINYKETGAENCELNEKTKETSTSANFKSKATWIYLSTDYTTRKIGSMCEAFDPCQYGSMCIDTCECPGYKCIKPTGNYSHEINSNLCDIKEATENIALRKKAEQSSNYDNNRGPDKAVDGILDPVLANIAATAGYGIPWWRVDIGKTACVQSVAIQNRGDCCGDHMNPFDIRVGDSLNNNGRDNQLCVKDGSILTGGELKRFPCAYPIPGRYVSVHLNRVGALGLSEVQVYGFFFAP